MSHLNKFIEHLYKSCIRINEGYVITPVTSQADWLTSLDLMPFWEPSSKPLLLLSPHPDDETLGAGGLVRFQRQRDVPVTVVAVTDGENAYADEDALGKIREKEQVNALASLGVDREGLIRLRLTDSDVAANEALLVSLLMPLASQHCHILAPWIGDFHPDHEACGRAASEVARRTGAELTFYIFWSWHRGTPEIFENLSLKRFPLTDELLLAKANALQCHRSQLEHASRAPILPESLLWPAILPFEVFLPS